MTREQLTRFYKRIGMVFGVGLIVVGLGLVRLITEETPPPPPNSALDLFREGSFVSGSESAPVEIFIFSRYDCPLCAKLAVNVLPEIEKEYVQTGKARLYFFEVVAPSNPASRYAFRAAECAAELGKFEEMRAVIYEEAENWRTAEKAREMFIEYGEKVDFDQERYQECLKSGAHDSKVTDRINLLKKAGIKRFPTVIVQDTMVRVPTNEGNLSAEIEKALEKAGG